MSNKLQATQMKIVIFYIDAIIQLFFLNRHFFLKKEKTIFAGNESK